MTNEERTELIRHLKYNRSIGADYLITDEDADEIIKALEQQPSDDCISRQVAIDIVVFECGEWIGLAREISKQLKQLPSVTPQPKIGQLRHYEGMLICSECGAEFYDDIMEYCGDDVPKCCPNCGAKMEEEE